MIWKKRNDIQTDDSLTIIQKLAKVRNIENINEFLAPPTSYEHSPYLLQNIDEVVEKIIKAIHRKQKITIMADVDADGICSAVIMYNYIHALTENVNIIHAQRSHGHGLETVLPELSELKNGKFLQTDTDLLIIVDSSSNSVEACKIAKEEYECDIVIIDHHQIDKENPYALIVNCQDGSYPNKFASGSAMVYKVIQVLDEYLGIEEADYYLDFVAIGLIADLMNLQDMENRSLVNRGLKMIQNEGLQQLLKVNNIDFYYGISSIDVGYKISPLINACSRYDKIELAIELFIENDVSRAKEIAKQMKKLNDLRKDEEKEIVESIFKKIHSEHKVAYVIDNDIEANFRGLICMQIVSKLKKPAFVFSYDKKKGEFHGSARSLGQINLKDYCEITGEFLYCQGHEKAFGLGISEEKLEFALNDLDGLIENNESDEIIEYDLEIDANEITEDMIKDVEAFSRITGQGVPQPVFLVKNCILQGAELLGKKVKETLKIQCENDLCIMKFKIDKDFAQPFFDAVNGDNFLVEADVVGTLNLNRYYNFGKKELVITKQIFMEDCKLYD